MPSPWPEIRGLVFGVAACGIAVQFTNSLWIGVGAGVTVLIAASQRSGPRWGNW